MSSLIPQQRPWWKEPMVWLIAGLPAIAVVASFTSYYFAAHNPDPLVKEEYHKVGLAPLAPASAASQVAAAMGLAAQLRIRNGQLQVDLRGHLAAPPRQLSIDILHPTIERQDIHIVLTQVHGLSYSGPAPDLGSGKRTLVLEPTDRKWRITGLWTAPFTGMVEIVAGTPHPATHP
jgi:uncharacterized protein